MMTMTFRYFLAMGLTLIFSSSVLADWSPNGQVDATHSEDVSLILLPSGFEGQKDLVYVEVEDESLPQDLDQAVFAAVPSALALGLMGSVSFSEILALGGGSTVSLGLVATEVMIGAAAAVPIVVGIFAMGAVGYAIYELVEHWSEIEEMFHIIRSGEILSAAGGLASLRQRHRINTDLMGAASPLPGTTREVIIPLPDDVPLLDPPAPGEEISMPKTATWDDIMGVSIRRWVNRECKDPNTHPRNAIDFSWRRSIRAHQANWLQVQHDFYLRDATYRTLNSFQKRRFLKERWREFVRKHLQKDGNEDKKCWTSMWQRRSFFQKLFNHKGRIRTFLRVVDSYLR